MVSRDHLDRFISITPTPHVPDHPAYGQHVKAINDEDRLGHTLCDRSQSHTTGAGATSSADAGVGSTAGAEERKCVDQRFGRGQAIETQEEYRLVQNTVQTALHIRTKECRNNFIFLRPFVPVVHGACRQGLEFESWELGFFTNCI